MRVSFRIRVPLRQTYQEVICKDYFTRAILSAIFPAIERRFVDAKPPLFRPRLNFILMHSIGKYFFERSQKSTLSLLVDRRLLPTLTAA